MEESRRFCPAVWFSGFFALGAAVHLIRGISGVQLVVGGFEVPIGMSFAIAGIFGMLSVGLAVLGVKRKCVSGRGPESCCQH
jgi:hypothetical protein